jgi:hypothetical protein
MRQPLLKSVLLGSAFVLLIWALGRLAAFKTVAEYIFLPGVWLAEIIIHGGIHADFLGAFFGYIAIVLNVLFYVVLIAIVLAVIRKSNRRGPLHEFIGKDID